jgi:PLP dependent protein
MNDSRLTESQSPAAVAGRLQQVQRQIDAACARSGRSPADVKIIAITKRKTVDYILAGVDAGLRHFGENRVEEAHDKIVAARERLPADATWHMVGHIQSRKTRDVAPLFDWVHSVDRVKVARRLDDAAAGAERALDALLEVNLSGEAGKYGYDLSRWPEDRAQADAFFAEVAEMIGLASLRWQGLMTLAPYTEEPEAVRPLFRRMRLLGEALRERFPAQGWPHLSMGMSGDYEVAVEEGATIVRIGTALFGPRPA